MLRAALWRSRGGRPFRAAGAERERIEPPASRSNHAF